MRRFERILGVLGVLAIVITISLVTPWHPMQGLGAALGDLLHRAGQISRPHTDWVQRVPQMPTGAVSAGSSVVVLMRDAVEARDVADGAQRWHRDSDWAAVAGTGGDAVVLVGRRGHGFEAVDPDSGSVRWRDGTAAGAWSYRDAVLTLDCAPDCTVAARSPADGAVRWRLALPGVGRVLAGANADLPGGRALVAGSYADAVAAAPRPLPPVLAFPAEQRVQVVDTVHGRRLGTESSTLTSRVTVLAGRLLVSTTEPRDGNCRYRLEVRDPATGHEIWHRDGYDLHTASGAGCEQRHDPQGRDGVLAATRGDNREVFLSVADGRELWVAGAGESIVGTDGRYGLVRTADHHGIRAVDLTRGGVLWSRAAAAKSEVAVTGYAVLVIDREAGRLLALDQPSGSVIVDVSTQASVIGYGPTGLVLARGRTVGYLPLAAT